MTDDFVEEANKSGFQIEARFKNLKIKDICYGTMGVESWLRQHYFPEAIVTSIEFTIVNSMAETLTS